MASAIYVVVSLQNSLDKTLTLLQTQQFLLLNKH